MGDTVPKEAIMDLLSVDPNMCGKVAGEEVVGEPEKIPNPSVAKDLEPEQVPYFSTTQDPESAQVLDPSTSQDPENAQVPDLAVAKDSEPKQTLGPTTTMVLEPKQISDPMVTKKSTKTATPHVAIGTSSLISSFFFS